MPRESPPYGYVIVFIAFIIMSVQWSVIYSFGVFVKPLLAEFGWTRAAVSGAFSLSSLLSSAIVIYMGWLNDRIGPRIVMSLCGILLGTGCVLVSQTQALFHLYISFGVIMGLSMGGQFTPLMSTVARWFTYRRGTMSGIVASGVGIGAMIGPQISNQLILNLGWRTAFAVLGVAALVIMVGCAQFLRREPGRNTPVDRDALQPAGANPAVQPGITHHQAIRSPQYWLFILTGFCYGYTVFSLTVHVVAHAIDTGMSATTAVGLLTTFGGLSVVGKLIFGHICDRIGSKATMMLGFGMVMLACLGLIAARTPWAIYAAVGVFGFFYGSVTVSQSPLTAVLFGLKSHGMILGVCATCVTLGGALGPYLTGFIFDHSGSYRIAFGASAGVALLGVFATARIRQHLIDIKA